MEEFTFENFLKEKRKKYKDNVANILGQELLPHKKKDRVKLNTEEK